MKRKYSEFELQKLRYVKYLGPLTMLIIVFYIAKTVFGLSAAMAGGIALGIAALEFTFFSILLSRWSDDKSDRIG
jgi:hypothetical protein